MGQGRLRRALRRSSGGFQRLIDGTGWLGACAVILGIVGLLAFATIAASPDFLMWTGERIEGLDLGGTVNYTFDGRAYSFQTNDRPENAPPLRVGVYLSPGEPGVAVEDRVSTRAIDTTFVMLPLALAFACLLAGWWRRGRRRRRQTEGEGHGFTPGSLSRRGGPSRGP